MEPSAGGAESSEIDPDELLAAAEAASPAAAVTAAAAHLERRLGAEAVHFWVADAAGQALLRQPDGERAPTADTEVGRAWREQDLLLGDSAWVPVTVRGDALGVLEVQLGELARGDEVDDTVQEQLRRVAHLLGYVIVANQRHTDAFELARRSRPYELSMEIQRRLLPQAFVCEGGSFTLAGWLEPSATAGGDTFDYVASDDRLTVAMIDAAGHDVRASLLATLTINCLRNARRDGASLQDQAAAAHAGLLRYANPDQYVTGLLIEAPLVTTGVGDEPGELRPVTARVVNAGHPPARLVRSGEVTRVQLTPDPPFGLNPDPDCGFSLHEVELQPGDRLALLTDGMYERSAEGLDLDALLVKTADRHPRNAVQDIALEFRQHVGGEPDDDATMLLLDWYGGTTGRSTSGGADTGNRSEGA